MKSIRKQIPGLILRYLCQKSICHLHGIVQDLVLVFLDAQNVLEHVVELFLRQNHFGRCRRLALRSLTRIFVAAVNLIKLGHPRAENRLLAQPIYLRQAADTLLDIILEHLTINNGILVNSQKTNRGVRCLHFVDKIYHSCAREISNFGFRVIIPYFRWQDAENDEQELLVSPLTS